MNTPNSHGAKTVGKYFVIKKKNKKNNRMLPVSNGFSLKRLNSIHGESNGICFFLVRQLNSSILKIFIKSGFK